MTFQIKQGTTRPAYQRTLRIDGAAVDLTDATAVHFSMASPDGTLVIDRQPGTFDDRAGGVVAYEWQDGDTNDAGKFNTEWIVTWDDGTTDGWPSKGFVQIEITPTLSPPP